MKRTTLNFWTDALAFIGFAFLTTSGILLRYQLPPGSGRLDVMGGGQRALQKPVSVLWGLTRHEWGDVHYYVALGLMAVLAFHLVLHWKWIVCVTRGKPVEGSGYRLGLGVIGLVAILLLTAAPLFAPSIQVPRSQLQDETAEESDVNDDETSMLPRASVSSFGPMWPFSTKQHAVAATENSMFRRPRDFTVVELPVAIAIIGILFCDRSAASTCGNPAKQSKEEK